MIIRIEDNTASVEVYGARRDVSLLLMPEEVNIGDYVLVHAGFAIQKVDESAALQSLALIREALEGVQPPISPSFSVRSRDA